MKNTSPMEWFFNLGNKATKGDPCRKAQFDYYLYFIVFLTFISLAINYFYQFFFSNGSFSSLMWGLIVTIFSWFNYFALGAFRSIYINMRNLKEIQKSAIKKIVTTESEEDSIDKMFEGFKDEIQNSQKKQFKKNK